MDSQVCKAAQITKAPQEQQIYEHLVENITIKRGWELSLKATVWPANMK